MQIKIALWIFIFNLQSLVHAGNYSLVTDQEGESEIGVYLDGTPCEYDTDCENFHDAVCFDDICQCRNGNNFYICPEQSQTVINIIGRNCTNSTECNVENALCSNDGNCVCERGHVVSKNERKCLKILRKINDPYPNFKYADGCQPGRCECLQERPFCSNIENTCMYIKPDWMGDIEFLPLEEEEEEDNEESDDGESDDEESDDSQSGGEEGDDEESDDSQGGGEEGDDEESDDSQGGDEEGGDNVNIPPISLLSSDDAEEMPTSASVDRDDTGSSTSEIENMFPSTANDRDDLSLFAGWCERLVDQELVMDRSSIVAFVLIVLGLIAGLLSFANNSKTKRREREQ